MMNNKLLTILGCSSSVALSLLGANSAHAKEYVFTAPELDSSVAEIPQSETDYPFLGCTCTEYDPETAAKLDKEGERAIDLYGCDCAGHRNMVRSLDSKLPTAY